MLTTISIATGYALDLLLGDPQNLPHPVRLIGNLIGNLEKKLRQRARSTRDEQRAGKILWFVTVSVSFTVPWALLWAISALNPWLAAAVEAIMCCYILATKSLRDESMKVYSALKGNDLGEARLSLSYIVGRDTEKLTETEIAKAAVETVAENTSDGVIAPMLFMLIGGAPLGFMYKAINTLDSMVGYKNDKYINIGRFSALADDAFNYIPSRLSAWLMIAAAYLAGMDGSNARRIYQRDRYKHLSPNSAHTESVCAGALRVKLAGGSYYGGVWVDKPAIGDDLRPIEAEDIKKANRLMYLTSIIWAASGLAARALIVAIIL